jgi:hypothetical protein
LVEGVHVVAHLFVAFGVLKHGFFGDISSGYDGRSITTAEDAGTNCVVVGAVLGERGVGGVTGARGAVCVLILLNVDEMPVQVRDQDRNRRSVGMMIISGALDGVCGV